MKVRSIELRDFRNHGQTTIPCANGINIFVGENGEGKTNILEAISYLCLTKSFFGSNDATALQIGKPKFLIRGELVADAGIRYNVDVSYDLSDESKTVSINNSPVEKFSSVVGRFPVVILSPEGNAITFGMPADRRKFIDFVVSQSSKRYFEDLLEYRRIVRQRNKILLDGKVNKADCSDLLEPWDEELVDRGAGLTYRRAKFVEEFTPYVVEVCRQLAGVVETPQLRYIPSVSVEEPPDEEQIRQRFREQLRAKRFEERKIGSTVVGPHRDELDLGINNRALRKYASQGQHKTVLVALKVAEFHYLSERCRETPILLLDDVFSEFDSHRSQRTLELLKSLGQTFITTTNESMFPAKFDWEGENKRHHVFQGCVSYAETGSVIH